jgi:cytochrome c553
VRQGLRFLRAELPGILAKRTDVLSPRMLRIIEDLSGDWRRLETLAKTGGSGTTITCSICHGRELKGVGPIPPIAGRSPTYIVRQLYEFQHSGRTGSASALMKQTVEKLSQDDMIALAAYVGSLEP